MTTTVEAPQPDLHAIKQRQQQTWASGDFGVVAARIVLVAEQLCDSADLHAGWRVLDVATGTGNAAIAAAPLGCTAGGVAYVPAPPERDAGARSPRACRSSYSKETRKSCRSRTGRSTRSPPSSARCSRPTTPRLRASCCA